MVHSAFLRVAAILHPIQMQRKPCHGLGQKPDTGVDRCDLHGTLLVYLFSGISFTEHKSLTGVADVIRYLGELGSIPWADAQPFKESHFDPSYTQRGPPVCRVALVLFHDISI